MTPYKEDYLKSIYMLGGKERVSNKQLAQVLGVSPASVSDMVAKLSREGYVEAEPYKGISLTRKGMERSVSLLRSHRLWEVFLMRHMGYAWSEVHEDAERLEHVTSPRLAQRLDEYLGHPPVCPHGAVIPTADGGMGRAARRTLFQMEDGESALIRRVSEEKELLEYLQERRIGLGTCVRVLAHGAYEGPLEVLADGARVFISFKAACNIFVDDAAPG